MDDDLPLLRSAFLVDQMNVDLPDFNIRCGLYSWKIHRRLLHHQSREEALFRTQRSNFVPMSADFGQDNPWMVARLIQFLYSHTYDIHCFEPCDARQTLQCTLDSILGHKKRSDYKGFTADKEKDTNRSDVEVHLIMCELANKHEMPMLLDHALHRAFCCGQDNGTAKEVLNRALIVMGMLKITKNDRLRQAFAAFIASNRHRIDEPTLQNWLRGDGSFAIEVVDCLIRRNRELEKCTADADLPPNLKKRRPSFDPLSILIPESEGDMVTTPILASRTIVEERRSITEG